MVRAVGWAVKGHIAILALPGPSSRSLGLPSETSREMVFCEPFTSQTKTTLMRRSSAPHPQFSLL